MKRKVRCPKCRKTYWVGEPHTCEGAAPPRPPAADGADPIETAVEVGCCLLELLSCLPWVLAVLATATSAVLIVR